MPFIIPNADDTGQNQAYIDVNQAEPDSLDLEHLGMRANWVRSGGEVTAVGSNRISVAAGVVVIANRPYSFSAVSNVSIANATANFARFDAVVARLSNGVVSVQVVQGQESATNPVLPRSVSVSNSGVIDPDTDVLLATVYKAGTTGVQAGNIIDKRIMSYQTTTWSLSTAGSTAPPSTTVGIIGDTIISSTTGSVFMKIRDTGTDQWRELTQSVQVSTFALPIGAIIGWVGPSTDPPSSGGQGVFLPCQGQTLSRSEYPELATVMGISASASTFTLPSITGNTVISGVARGTSGYGVPTGSNSVTLVEGNLPRHSHDQGGHNHGIRVQRGSVPGGADGNSKSVLTARTDQGTADTINTLQMDLLAFGAGNPSPIDVRGRYIPLSYYIRVK